MLSSGAWIATAATVDPGLIIGGTVVSNVYAQYPACVKDNTITFNADKTGNTDEGGSKCDPNDNQTSTFTWIFNSDETIITVTEGQNVDDFEIVSLSSTELVYKSVEVIDGITYTTTTTAEHP